MESNSDVFLMGLLITSRKQKKEQFSKLSNDYISQSATLPVTLKSRNGLGDLTPFCIHQSFLLSLSHFASFHQLLGVCLLAFQHYFITTLSSPLLSLLRDPVLLQVQPSLPFCRFAFSFSLPCRWISWIRVQNCSFLSLCRAAG